MSTATKAEPPKYDFSAKIPNIPDLKSSGEIKNLTAIQNLTVSVPRRVSNVNGTKTVSLLHPEINNITFLFIQPNEHSDECRKLICRPVGSSQTGPSYGQGSTSGPYPTQDIPSPKEAYQYGGGTGGGTSGGGYQPNTPPPQYGGGTGGGTSGGGYSKIKLPPPPPKDLPESGCYFIPREASDPSKGGYYYYQNDPDDPSKGGYYYMVSSQGQQQTQTMQQPTDQQTQTMQQPTDQQTQTMQQPTDQQTQTMQQPTDVSTLSLPTSGSIAIDLENDLFLMGNSLIRLLGNVNTLRFDNALDKEVSIQIVIGYPVDRPSI